MTRERPGARSAERAILRALRGEAMTDAAIARATGLPSPSVRRTRRAMVLAGTLIQANPGFAGDAVWRVRRPWELPDNLRRDQWEFESY